MSDRDALEIVTVARDDVEVDVVPGVGARLHRLRVRRRDLLRTPDDLHRHLDDSWFWGSYPMAPWCNRLPAGVTRDVAGGDLDLPSNFRDGTAIHGQVARAPWSRIDDDTFRVRAGGDGWPWPYEVEQVVAPSAGALEITLRLTNLGDTAMPAGLGIHPWFRRPLRVRIAAAAAWDANPSPAAEASPVAGALDRRALVEMPDGLDATWTVLDEPPVTLEWPEAGIRAIMSTSPRVSFIVAASPAGIDAVAVEPETHAPAGVRRLLQGEPGALELLSPGETMTLAVRLAFVDVDEET
jgi:aldose 1-epimerase